ncbi:MAG: TIGR03936 family radical SAM-associated protein, partial [Candidatus Desulfofervidus auxilii]|nr:TIGR03936 family radical SAM-associated protein [Candidatus Desulfofervidus auxilii]
IDLSKYLGPRVIDEELPWDFIDTGVSKNFLKKELVKAKKGDVTPDCRWGDCSGCGACNFKNISPVLNSKQKSTQNLAISKKIKEEEDKFNYLFRFEKKDFAAYLSQLELQKVIERIMRRANVHLAFSQGYNPRPKISFGRALPVGIQSLCEFFGVQVIKKLDENILEKLNTSTIPGIKFTSYQAIERQLKVPYSIKELFKLVFVNKKERYLKEFNKKSIKKIYCKKKEKQIPLDLILEKWEIRASSIYFVFDWRSCYLNPLIIIKTIFTNIDPLDFRLIKLRQYF